MSKKRDIYSENSLSRIHGDWSCLVGQSFRLMDSEFRDMVVGYARQMMARARMAIELIIRDLATQGYRFADPDNVWQPPDESLLTWLQELNIRNVHIPISLQAWLMEVGNVNLTGTHPGWSKPGYVFDEMEPGSDVLYSDPLVVECTKDSIESTLDEWEMRVDEEGIEQVGQFMIEVGPDHIHKANVSGGAPYIVQGYDPSVDSIVVNERKCVSFTEYIRNAIRWHGFPGFEYMINNRVELPRILSGELPVI